MSSSEKSNNNSSSTSNSSSQISDIICGQGHTFIGRDKSKYRGCAVCGIHKPRCAFSSRQSDTVPGMMTRCKDCARLNTKTTRMRMMVPIDEYTEQITYTQSTRAEEEHMTYTQRTRSGRGGRGGRSVSGHGRTGRGRGWGPRRGRGRGSRNKGNGRGTISVPLPLPLPIPPLPFYYSTNRLQSVCPQKIACLIN